MKSEEELIKIISSAIEDSKNGLSKENPKLDFKSKWYDLKNDFGIMEFLKDTSSIANTVGLDGYIVIGFDDRKKEFTNTKFSDSKLKDNNELNWLIVKHVSSAFTLNQIDVVINGKHLSILHIPPSLDKPHCIKMFRTFDKEGKPKGEYENRILVKRNSNVAVANRYEIDLMYYDRKNLEPEYLPKISITSCSYYGQWVITTCLIVENAGRRPMSIKEITFDLTNPWNTNNTITLRTLDNREDRFNQRISASNLIVNPATIAKYVQVTFHNNILRLTDDTGYELALAINKNPILPIKIHLADKTILNAMMTLNI